MPSPEIRITSLDGLNNNGKTTQLRYLQDKLEIEGVPTIVRRGDGARKGIGTAEADPVSKWWQDNHKRIYDAGFEGPAAARVAAESSRRLMGELYVEKTETHPERLAAEGKDKGAILLDRGPVSRLFVARRYEPDISFEAALGLDEDPRLRQVIPDEVIVLHAAKEILLARNDIRDDGGKSKRAFNEQVLSDYFDDFERTLCSLPPELAERTTIIDSTPSIDEVGRITLEAMTDMR